MLFNEINCVVIPLLMMWIVCELLGLILLKPSFCKHDLRIKNTCQEMLIPLIFKSLGLLVRNKTCH